MATTVGARIKFDADSRDAVRAMSRLERAAEGTRQSLGRIGDVAGGAALGVAGLGTVEEALTRVVDGLTESVRAYAAADSDVGEQVAGTAEQFRGLQESIGAAVIGGENANLIFGATQQIIGELSRIVADNETAIRSLTINAFAGFLDVTVAGVRFVNGLVDVFAVAKLAAKGLALGVTELGIALAGGLLIPVEAASLAIANMVSDLTDALRTAHQVAVGLGGASANTSLHVNGGVITNSDQVATKRYSNTFQIGSGTGQDIQFTFRPGTFYARVVAVLRETSDVRNTSTMILELSGGTHDGTTASMHDIVIGTKNLFGATNSYPWSPTVTAGTRSIDIRPATKDLGQNYNYDLSVEVTSACDGGLVKISKNINNIATDLDNGTAGQQTLAVFAY